MGEYAATVTACETALKSSPDFHEVMLPWARALARQLKFRDSFQMLKTLNEKLPGNKAANEFIKKLQKEAVLVDSDSALFDTTGMKRVQFHSDYNQIRFFTLLIVQDFNEELLFGRLLEQQLSELLKNAIKHGNRGKVDKKVTVWYESIPRARFIVEDEGDGFAVDAWNQSNHTRLLALESGDFDEIMKYMTFSHSGSDEDDGGNALFAALEFWDEGLVFNESANRVAVVKGEDENF